MVTIDIERHNLFRVKKSRIESDKINKIIPDIQNEIKQRTDKKLEEVKNRIEQKRQEIQQRLDTIKKDLQQEKNTESSQK